MLVAENPEDSKAQMPLVLPAGKWDVLLETRASGVAFVPWPGAPQPGLLP